MTPLQLFQKSKITLIALLIISVIAISVFYNLLKTKPRLPIYNPIDVNPKLVNSDLQHIRKGHRVGDFHLIDQKGKSVTPVTFENKIYIADFFFTSCPSICPIMTKNMRTLQEYFQHQSEIMFLSHSVTPQKDTIPVLAKYAQKNKINYQKWRIVTGAKKHIYTLARAHYFAALSEGDGGEQDFIHTEQFVLIDKKKRIRGFYDGTDQKAIENIKKDIVILLQEP